jgi:hypothetical protein
MPENSDYGIVPTSFRPEEYVWIKKKLGIDLLDISEEIIELPGLIQKTGEYTSAAIELREAAENELKYTIAQEAESLRTTPTPKGKARSETQIQSEIGLSPAVKQKQEALSEARLNASLWQVLVESLRRKDSGIRVAADLINSGYLAKDTIVAKRRQEIRNAKD